MASFGAIAERSHNTRHSAGSKKRLSYVRPTCTMRAHRTSLSLVQYRALPKPVPLFPSGLQTYDAAASANRVKPTTCMAFEPLISPSTT